MLKKIKCNCCGYEGNEYQWSEIRARDNTGYTSLMFRRYNLETKKHDNCGSVALLACPKCESIQTWK